MPRCIDNALTILDVGHGSACVLLVGDEVVVFDAGPGTGLLEFLKQQEIQHLKTVFLSHADQDHIGAVAQLIATKIAKVDRVVVNSDSIKKTDTWDDLVYELAQQHQSGEIRFDIGLVAGTIEKYSAGTIKSEVVAPNPYLAAKGPGAVNRSGRKITTNTISAVLRLSSSSGPVALLAGDLDDLGLEELLGSGIPIEAPVLVFPHHGGKLRSTKIIQFVDRLCGAVKPHTVVFSIGRGRYKTPNPEVVHAVRSALPASRIICTQLSENCALDLPVEQQRHLGPAFAVGAADRRCCGGSIIVDLDDPTYIVPDIEKHQEFVAEVTETPLCTK